MKKIIITVCLFCQILLAIDKLPITEYLSMLSSDLDMTFVISEDIEEEFTLMLPKHIEESQHLKILVQVLKKNDLIIESHGNFFVISKKKEDKEQKKLLHFVTLKNIDYDSIKNFFNSFENIRHSYITSNKTIAFQSTNEEFKRISTLIKTVDKIPNQLKLKVSIIDTNVNKLKEFGSNFQTNFTSSSSFFFNLLAYPFEISSELSNSQSNSLTAYFKLLNQNDISTLVSSPTVTIFDNVKTSLSVVKNIPVLSGTTIQQDNTTTSTESISYRDVGLILEINPKIYNDYAYLDMKIINETITTYSDTPTTSKNTISQRITLKKNKSYVLTGVNQKQNIRSVSKVPLLSELPLIDWLFKMEEDEDINSNLTIILQLVDDNYSNNVNKVELPILKEIKQKKELTEHQKRVNQILNLN